MTDTNSRSKSQRTAAIHRADMLTAGHHPANDPAAVQAAADAVLADRAANPDPFASFQ